MSSALSLINEKKLADDNKKQVLSFITIKNKVSEVIRNYDVDKIYLYGSYAKGEANVDSDIDLYMISNIEGLDYFGLVEDLRNSLNKKIDLLSNKTVKKNSPIEEEIKKTRITIYKR